MGCPDWPKCFGLLAPPTCECQLPGNYQQVFLEKRIAKLNRFTALLDKIGMHEKAETLRKDPKILVPEEFNVAKAWTEYVNRIFGVLSGLFSLAFLILAFAKPHSSKTRFYVVLSLVMLVLNAWLGSIVVVTNLLPGMVSIHFIISFLCIFFGLIALQADQKFNSIRAGSASTNTWLLFTFAVMMEVLLGTWSRERADYLLAMNSLAGGSGMIDLKAMGMLFMIHRFFPGVIFAIAGWNFWKQKDKIPAAQSGYFAIAIVSLLQICFGAVNTVFVLPAWSQVSHIVAGSLLPVITFYYWLASQKDTAQASSTLNSALV